MSNNIDIIDATSGETFAKNQPSNIRNLPLGTVIDPDASAEPISAANTLTGATSQDVYSGIGKPTGGQTSQELHHDGKPHRKRGQDGSEQFGQTHEQRLARREGEDA